MNRRVLITSYENPDLDGTTCMIVYAEFLSKTGVARREGVIIRKEITPLLKEYLEKKGK